LKAVVIGSGVSGLTAAVALANAGLDVTVCGVFSLNPEPVYDKRMPAALGKQAEQLFHYSIRGGIHTLVDALIARIEAQGGKVRTACPVRRIQIEKGQVAGVVLEGGEFLPAGLVIASGGARETFFKLVGKEQLPDGFIAKVEGQPLMDSVFMIHLGIDFDPSQALSGTVTYFYGAYEIESALRKAKAGSYHEGRDGFVIHAPTLHSPEMAPAGRHALTIYTVAPDRLSEGDWTERKEEYADRLVACAERFLPGLSDHILTCEIITPADFRLRTHLDHHAFGGVAPLQNTPRVPHQTPISGLWFVGAQSQSGGGVNNGIPAAYKTALAALKAPAA
jgi:phytoene dehydrogenase-like protein